MIPQVRHAQHWRLVAEAAVDCYPLRLYELSSPVAADAPAIVLIHGLEEGWEVWTEVILVLAGHYRCFCVGCPWQGREGYAWGQVLSTRGWIDRALRLVPVIPHAIIAHSFGATATLEWLTYGVPQALRGAILLSPFYRTHPTDFDWDLFEACRRGFRGIMQQGLEVRQFKNVDQALLGAMTDKVMDRIGPLGFCEFFALFARTPQLDLSTITVPILIVTGAHDLPLTAYGNVELCQGLPQGYLKVVPQCGHFCMLEQPVQLAESMHQFLQPLFGRE